MGSNNFRILVYGVYEDTSYAIIKNWTFNTFIIDILWGTTLFFTSTKLFYKLKQYL